MIACEDLYDAFKDSGIDFFTGVPDSTFKDWTKYLADRDGRGLTNIIASNECEAVAVAAGYHLATGMTGVVYMQNSGLGKCVNPLTSLADKEIYSIPMLLMIGWRGEPGKKDEPQHRKMGRITIPLLETLEIPYIEMPDDSSSLRNVIRDVGKYIADNSSQYAIVIKKGIFEEYKIGEQDEGASISRENAIRILVENLDESDAVISTTGKTSRELFECRIARNEKPRDFYTVGSMGCSASVALGAALLNKKKRFFVFDGDGSVLMQMGSLATIGHYKPKNFYHIVFDNNSHASTGGQPTVSDTARIEQIAMAAGYKKSYRVFSEQSLSESISKIKNEAGPVMIIVDVKRQSRKDLGRPTTTPNENKQEFMRFLDK